MLKEEKEGGFVLITALVLLSILTLLGITSQYKTMVEIKVSSMMAAGERAEMAANAGLVNQFWAWNNDTNGGKVEFASLITYVASGTGTVPDVYHGDKTPVDIDDVKLPVDSAITAANGYNIYTIKGNTIDTTIAWGVGVDPQVAVWATTFEQVSGSAYPYSSSHDVTTDGSCSGCRLVTYALGRSGEARRLIRETQSIILQSLSGVSAMTNAPAGNNFAEICAGTTPTSSTGAGVAAWTATSNGSAVLEVTQAPYLTGLVPSGTALQSNTHLGVGGKGFRSDITSTTGATFESAPILIYSGHDTYSNVRLDYAYEPLDTTGVQMPASKLPTKLVNAPMFDPYGGAIEYFSDPTQQLFEMDAYRWAAEQFVCQTPDNPFVAPFYTDGVNGNGAYCSKADALRRSLIGLGFPAYAPVTGRLTIAQFQYNVANGIPMFGLVRLMFPAVTDSGIAAQTCQGITTQLHVIQSSGDNSGVDMYANTGWDFNKLMAGGTYTGYIPIPDRQGYAFAPSADNVNANAEPDDDGSLGPNARIILYGSFLIDYFADYNITGDGSAGFASNSVFDVAGGERILGILESPDVYLAIEHNILLNPAMPRFTGDPLAFPTAAIPILPASTPAAAPSRLGNNPELNVAADRNLAVAGRMNMVDVNSNTDPAKDKRVHLASPYDGYFPWSEGLVPVAGEGNVGTMRLMSRATTADNVGSVGLVKSMAATSSPAIPTANMLSLLGFSKPARAGMTAGKESDILHYYYRLMMQTANQQRDNDWPIASWPGATLSSNFCIGKEDCGVDGTNNNNGDKTHLMFPSGYMHGWKVALAALDMSADEWNNMLTGITTPVGSVPAASLWEQLADSCDGTMCRLGRPFSVDDVGLYKAVDLEQGQSKYFYVTPDATTGYGLMDSAWQDIPTQMYSGGLLDMHAHSNMNGIIYTPGPLEWEPGNSNYDTGVHLSYVTGAIITGFGAYTKNKTPDDRYIMVYDSHAVDNIATSSTAVVLRRYDWQLLQ